MTKHSDHESYPFSENFIRRSQSRLMTLGGPPGWRPPPSRNAEGVEGEGNVEGSPPQPISGLGSVVSSPSGVRDGRMVYFQLETTHMMATNCLEYGGSESMTRLPVLLPLSPPPLFEMYYVENSLLIQYSIPPLEFAPLCLWARSKNFT